MMGFGNARELPRLGAYYQPTLLNNRPETFL